MKNFDGLTSAEKMDILLALDKQNKKLKITTYDGKEYKCRLERFAEDEDDWAYNISTLEDPPKYFTIECGFIKNIEEL